MIKIKTVVDALEMAGDLFQYLDSERVVDLLRARKTY